MLWTVQNATILSHDITLCNHCDLIHPYKVKEIRLHRQWETVNGRRSPFAGIAGGDRIRVTALLGSGSQTLLLITNV